MQCTLNTFQCKEKTSYTHSSAQNCERPPNKGKYRCISLHCSDIFFAVQIQSFLVHYRKAQIALTSQADEEFCLHWPKLPAEQMKSCACIAQNYQQSIWRVLPALPKIARGTVRPPPTYLTAPGLFLNVRLMMMIGYGHHLICPCWEKLRVFLTLKMLVIPLDNGLWQKSLSCGWVKISQDLISRQSSIAIAWPRLLQTIGMPHAIIGILYKLLQLQSGQWGEVNLNRQLHQLGPWRELKSLGYGASWTATNSI